MPGKRGDGVLRAEAILRELSDPNVFQCCVVSDPHPKYKYVTKAHIVLKKTEKDPEEILYELKKLCEENLPDYSCPFSYSIKESLPLTAVGKVDWRALEQQAGETSKE